MNTENRHPDPATAPPADPATLLDTLAALTTRRFGAQARVWARWEFPGGAVLTVANAPATCVGDHWRATNGGPVLARRSAPAPGESGWGWGAGHGLVFLHIEPPIPAEPGPWTVGLDRHSREWLHIGADWTLADALGNADEVRKSWADLNRLHGPITMMTTTVDGDQ